MWAHGRCHHPMVNWSQTCRAHTRKHAAFMRVDELSLVLQPGCLLLFLLTMAITPSDLESRRHFFKLVFNPLLILRKCNTVLFACLLLANAQPPTSTPSPPSFSEVTARADFSVTPLLLLWLNRMKSQRGSTSPFCSRQVLGGVVGEEAVVSRGCSH